MYGDITDIKKANQDLGHHWFDRDTMKFFGSKVESGVIAGRYFVTSEQPPHGGRVFSIRRANDDGSIDTVGEHGGYQTRAAALAEARAIAEKEE